MDYVRMKVLLALTILVMCRTDVVAQQCPADFVLQADIASSCAEMSMTMHFDRLGRGYLYVARKTHGLAVYDVSKASSPTLVATLDSNAFGGLDVMNLTQNGDYLCVALGNHFTNPESGGAAIVDVTNPLLPRVTHYFVVPGERSGAGMAVMHDDFVFLAAMQTGLVVLNATDKYDLKWVSTFLPDMNYPEPNPDTPKYNVRGLEISGDTAYLAFDAGGVRLVDVSAKVKPVEFGRYSHSLLNGKPRAYNNVLVHDNYLYVTTDFCGLEVLRLVPQSNPVGVGWWNPHHCVTGNWFASPFHTNEIRFDSTCNKVFVSGGRTEVVVIDVSNPAAPESCAAYGVTDDDIAAWGIDVLDNHIALSYVCALVPFTSLRSGVRLLEYTPCTTSAIEDPKPSAADPFSMDSDHEFVTVYNMFGERMPDGSSLTTGVYVEIRSGTIPTPYGPSTATPNRGVLRIYVNGVDDVTYNNKHRP